MFVSIHIPKTAGTAIAKIFDETSSRKIMYEYGSEMNLNDVRHCPEDIRLNSNFIRGYFKYFHGHFHYLKYADVFADCPFITMVRHPVDRVISQYFHILRNGDRNNKQHFLIMNGEMNLVEFSKFPYIGNAQWHYLEGRAIEDYDFVLIQEYFEATLFKFALKFGLIEICNYLEWNRTIPLINIKPENQQLNEIKITHQMKQEIFKNCEKDVELYRKASEVHGI